jgi:hypothetical protein
VITIIGGLLSIFRTATDVGGVLEFIGTTVAIGWLACYGLWLAWRPSLVRDPAERTSDYERSAYERPDAISASS